MTRPFTTEEARALHAKLAAATGGAVGLRDEGLLESALAGAFQTFGGVPLYPTDREKAARIGYSLIANHPFADGNKRIGTFVMFVFLRLCGIRVTATNDEVVRMALAVANSEMDAHALTDWVLSHTA